MVVVPGFVLQGNSDLQHSTAVRVAETVDLPGSRSVFLYETTTQLNGRRFASRVYRTEFGDGSLTFSVETELASDDYVITDGRTITGCLLKNRVAVSVALAARAAIYAAAGYARLG